MNIRNKRWLSVFTLLICGMLVATGIEAKKPEPPKECIVFTGDLIGMAEVEGCCPNAGPYPTYTMTFKGTESDGSDDVSYDGQLFINFTKDKVTRDLGYKVQFWNRDIETPSDGEIFFEINGGDIFYDRKADLLFVIFKDEEATLWEYYDSGDPSETQLSVSFELERTSDLADCDE